MKAKYIFLLVMFVAAFSVTYVTSLRYNEARNENKEHESSEGMEDDALQRMAWETSRLADPATGRIPDNIRQMELAFAATLPNDLQGDGKMMSLTMTNRGPWNLGGRTRAFGVDVANENRLLAGTTSGGMWLSTDGGASWNPSNTLSQLKNATCLTQDQRPTHTNTWYYGSGEAYGASASSGSGAYYLGDGLFKSTDGGATWSAVASTAGGSPGSFTTGWQLVWNVTNDNSANDTLEEVYAAIYGGIMRSVNGGTSWTTLLGGNSYFTDVQVSATGTAYATLSDDGTSKGIWRQKNDSTFVNITPAGFPTAYNRIVIGIDPNDENTVYFLANTPGFGKVTYNYLGDPEWNSFWKYTYVSGTGAGTGGTWQDLSMNLPNTGGQFDRWQVQGSYDMVVKVKPGNSNIVYIGGTNLYRSTTAFQDSVNTTFIGGYQQFSALPVINSYANHHPDQHGLFFLPSNPDIMFSHNDGGIYKTLNDTASTVVWQSLNNGYLTGMFYTCAIDHATPGNNIIIGGAQDNGSWYTNSSVPTAPWVQPRGGDGSYCQIADGQTNYYFSIQNAKMMKATLDGAGAITSFARIDPIGLKKPEFVNPYTLDPNNNNIMYLAGGKYLWRNNDLSGIPMVGNWDSISTNWTQFVDSVPASNQVITAVTACKVPANRVYYGTSSRRVYRVDNANVGTPTPVDITSTTTGVVFPNGYVSCIAVDPLDGNKLIVTYSNYGIYSTFYSADGGTTWAKAGGNLEASATASPSIRWASFLHVADGTVYLLATSTGLYATDTLKGTATVWVQQATGTIGNSVCDMIDVRQSDGLVVVATHASGIYSTHITSVNDIATVHEIAASKNNLQLMNYPNPVTQSSTIEFTLDSRCEVTLQVWDAYGRILETLVNESMSEGRHSVVFDRKSYASGVYYYSLTAGDKRKTNKMILAK
ncbi:MAG: T9SS type A sorting domain-containing protein [Bacteroidia bacterium]